MPWKRNQVEATGYGVLNAFRTRLTNGSATQVFIFSSNRQAWRMKYHSSITPCISKLQWIQSSYSNLQKTRHNTMTGSALILYWGSEIGNPPIWDNHIKIILINILGIY
jgi:hypothetical protein